MNLNNLPLRVYTDTTVFGGIVDLEFERASRIFFEEVRARHFATDWSRQNCALPPSAGATTRSPSWLGAV